jgi:hypothetical protein
MHQLSIIEQSELTIEEAQSKLPELLEAVAEGKEVIIIAGGKRYKVSRPL